MTICRLFSFLFIILASEYVVHERDVTPPQPYPAQKTHVTCESDAIQGNHTHGERNVGYASNQGSYMAHLNARVERLEKLTQAARKEKRDATYLSRKLDTLEQTILDTSKVPVPLHNMKIM